jgi:hypothetical protein
MAYNPYSGAPPAETAKAGFGLKAPLAMPSMSSMFGSTTPKKPSDAIPSFDGSDVAASTSTATPSYGSRPDSWERERGSFSSPSEHAEAAVEDDDGACLRVPVLLATRLRIE